MSLDWTVRGQYVALCAPFKNISRTRVSACRGTNTPGRCHFLMYKNNLSWGKINGPWNIGHWPTYIWVTLIHYPKYNVSTSDSLQDMKQNCWTIKYWSLTYIYLVRSNYVSQWSIIATMMFIHQIILKILSKITRSWNIGHVDLYLLWGQSLGHTVSLSENMTLMHQKVLEI